MARMENLPTEILAESFSIGCDPDSILWNPPARLEDRGIARDWGMCCDGFLNRLKLFLIALSQTCSFWRKHILSSEENFESQIILGRVASVHNKSEGEAVVLHDRLAPDKVVRRLAEILERTGAGSLNLLIGPEWINECDSRVVFGLIRDQAHRIREIDVRSHAPYLLKPFIQHLTTVPSLPRLVAVTLHAAVKSGPREHAPLVSEETAVLFVKAPRLSVIEISNVDLELVKRSFNLEIPSLRVQTKPEEEYMSTDTMLPDTMSMSALWTSILPMASTSLSRLIISYDIPIGASRMLPLSGLRFPMVKELRLANNSFKEMLAILGQQRFPVLKILHLQHLWYPHNLHTGEKVYLPSLHTFVLSAHSYLAIQLCRAIQMPVLVSFNWSCAIMENEFHPYPYRGMATALMARYVEIRCNPLEPGGTYELFECILFPRLIRLNVYQEPSDLFEMFRISSYNRPFLPELVHLKLNGEGSFLLFDHLCGASNLNTLEIGDYSFDNITTVITNYNTRKQEGIGRHIEDLTLTFWFFDADSIRAFLSLFPELKTLRLLLIASEADGLERLLSGQTGSVDTVEPFLPHLRTFHIDIGEARISPHFFPVATAAVKSIVEERITCGVPLQSLGFSPIDLLSAEYAAWMERHLKSFGPYSSYYLPVAPIQRGSVFYSLSEYPVTDSTQID